jgi:hypothetical protein
MCKFSSAYARNSESDRSKIQLCVPGCCVKVHTNKITSQLSLLVEHFWHSFQQQLTKPRQASVLKRISQETQTSNQEGCSAKQQAHTCFMPGFSFWFWRLLHNFLLNLNLPPLLILVRTSIFTSACPNYAFLVLC